MSAKDNPCPDCGEDNEHMFGLNRATKDGLQVYCYDCKNARGRVYNNRRRPKIREWERAHSTACIDCGEKTAEGYRNNRSPLRCGECARAYQRAEAIADSKQVLSLRRAGLLNYEIAELLGVTPQAVASRLSRSRLKKYGLLNERPRSPYWERSAA